MNTAPFATRIKHYLDRQGTHYQLVHHGRYNCETQVADETGAQPEQIACATVLYDAQGVVMAVTSAANNINVERISQLLGRELKRLETVQADQLFRDCEPGCHPPIGPAYSIPTIAEKQLLDNKHIFFHGGCPSSLIKVEGSEFKFLMGQASFCSISEPKQSEVSEAVSNSEAIGAAINLDAVRQKLLSVYQLPPMPAMALNVLDVVNNPDSTLVELAKIVELDPSITAQVMRYASSPLYGYRGKLESVQDAISRVLGFDMVSSIALGVATSKAFSLPKEGPLGTDAYWLHAFYSAAISQKLAKTLSKKDGVSGGTIYLAALLQNFGVLILGHLFQPEYRNLNNMVQGQPDCALAEMEKRIIGMGQAQQVIGVGHAQLGAWLLEHWNMPEEIVVVAAHHHDAEYDGDYQSYIWLIQLVNTLLKQRGIGDEQRYDKIPEALFNRLGLEVAATQQLFDQAMVECQGIEQMARQIAP